MQFKIKNLILPNNVVAAPLAGFSDIAWRILARGFGAGIVFSEMIAVEGVLRRHKKTLTYLENDERARPFAIQLFGATPNSFVRSIEVINEHPEYKFDLIDINMGCPVKKVVKKGAGSALMKSPENVEAIVSAVRRAYDGPLTVKIRAGWDLENINAAQVARIVQDCGADAVIVHPRTQTQQFSGRSNWEIIADVKRSVSIPVVGNGDVRNKRDIEQMFTETGCDGVMIGRGAISRPWIFGDDGSKSVLEILDVIKQHIKLLEEHEDEKYTVCTMRKFIPKYLKGVRGHKELVHEVCGAASIDKILESLELFERFHKKSDGGDV